MVSAMKYPLQISLIIPAAVYCYPSGYRKKWGYGLWNKIPNMSMAVQEHLPGRKLILWNMCCFASDNNRVVVANFALNYTVMWWCVNGRKRDSSFSSIVRSDISVILVQNWHHGVSKSAKRASPGYWTHNTNPTLRFPAPLTTQPPRHLLNRRFMNWTLIISGLIEHDFKRVWKFEAGMDWQIGWVGKGAGILIVGLVLWVQYPVEAIFFFADFETPWC